LLYIVAFSVTRFDVIATGITDKYGGGNHETIRDELFLRSQDSRDI